MGGESEDNDRETIGKMDGKIGKNEIDYGIYGQESGNTTEEFEK